MENLKSFTMIPTPLHKPRTVGYLLLQLHMHNFFYNTANLISDTVTSTIMRLSVYCWLIHFLWMCIHVWFGDLKFPLLLEPYLCQFYCEPLTWLYDLYPTCLSTCISFIQWLSPMTFTGSGTTLWVFPHQNCILSRNYILGWLNSN